MAASIFPALRNDLSVHQRMATTDSRLERIHRSYHAANVPRNRDVHYLVRWLNSMAREWEESIRRINEGVHTAHIQERATLRNVPGNLLDLGLAPLPREHRYNPWLSLPPNSQERIFIRRVKTTICRHVSRNEFVVRDDYNGQRRVEVRF